ncbi:MAG: SDR family oxidoreductase [Lachnospiraceae bacterium]|nr:SDR family oxidoreductase [Lachnospiraceae bacterium]
MVDYNFQGKVYIVTGASSGMGKCCSEQLISCGAAVIGMDINPPTVTESSYSHELMDVSDEKSVENAFSKVKESFLRIDGLVNAAGIFANNKPFYELTKDEWDKVININTTGSFLASKQAAKLMIPNNRGKIVNISCIRSTVFKNNMADYAASKGAVASMTSAMALDLAPYNIQVNAVAPGFIYTGMTAASFDNSEIRKSSEALIPQGRIGTPEDIAGVVMFLLSDASGYMTGSLLYADGGYHISK